jgi:hypothetical protein
MEKCKNNSCDYDNTLARNTIEQRSIDEIHYARLWAEIELPKLLQKEKPT